jgi:hypothetical protein
LPCSTKAACAASVFEASVEAAVAAGAAAVSEVLTVFLLQAKTTSARKIMVLAFFIIVV